MAASAIVVVGIPNLPVGRLEAQRRGGDGPLDDDTRIEMRRRAGNLRIDETDDGEPCAHGVPDVLVLACDEE